MLQVIVEVRESYPINATLQDIVDLANSQKLDFTRTKIKEHSDNGKQYIVLTEIRA